VAADLLHEVDELRRCLASLGERLAAAGVHGSAELPSRDAAASAVAAIDHEEIAEAVARGQRIVAELAALLGCLQALRESKERLDHAHAPRAS
jgi:hypothetical protein